MESFCCKQSKENCRDNRRHCPSDNNIADIGSRGANIEKMVKGEWFEGPEWLLSKKDWPNQPELKSSSAVNNEFRPMKETVFHTNEVKSDEWENF